MVHSLCILACALTVGQVVERGDWQLSPQLSRGLELVYAGTYLEEALAPNVRHQKRYRLETTVFVIETAKQHVDVAVMTALGEQEAAPASVPASASKPARPGPVSVRLDLAQIDAQGRIRARDGKPLSIAVNGPSTLEVGFLVQAPLTRVGPSAFWEVNEEGQPNRSWQILGTERCAGVTCIKVVGSQQSADWDHPRADQTAWRRKDVIWLAPQLHVALKVERVLERRDPAHQVPTHRATVRYELESKLRYPGRMFDDRQREILALKKFQTDAVPLLAQPAVYRSQLEALIKKVTFHVENQPATPYRKAVLHFMQTLDKARHGETAVATNPEEPVPAVRRVALGEHMPDFVVTSLTDKEPMRLKQVLGQPVLVVFYNPATGVGREVILYAKALWEKQDRKLHVLAMAIASNREVACKQRRDLRLPFPILDGQALRLTLAVENTPRFVLLDADGIVRWECTGWGDHIPADVGNVLAQCRKQ